MTVQPAAGLRLSDRQRLSWLRLIRTDNVGPSSFRHLINRFGSAENALAVLPELAIKGGAPRVARIPSIAEAETEMETAARTGAFFVAIGEPDYPAMLRQMDLPPPLVAIKGRPDVFALPPVSIVGSRNASANGAAMARKLAHEMGQQGYAVVSGLARGIDAAAHIGSLATGTIAVLAGGIDRPYPPENLKLCAEIAERGALITEMPFGWEPRARDFPRRNRLVAGLGLGLIVIEAAKRSGSLISARLANEMGRIVFAVPGSPMDPRCEGANGLLKEGATIVTGVEDILEALSPMAGTRQPLLTPLEEPPPDIAAAPPSEDERALVTSALGPTRVHNDAVIRYTGRHPAQVTMVLVGRDLAGRRERHSGGRVSLIAHP